MAKLHIDEPMATAVVLTTAATTGLILWSLTSGTSPPKESWFPWLLLALGAAGLLNGIFDRKMKPNLKRPGRADLVMFLLGPTASRMFFAAIGGGFLGAAISVFSAS